MSEPQQSDLFKKMYYVSFSVFATMGIGYLGWKVYNEALEGGSNSRKNKPRRKNKNKKGRRNRRDRNVSGLGADINSSDSDSDSFSSEYDKYDERPVSTSRKTNKDVPRLDFQSTRDSQASGFRSAHKNIKGGSGRIKLLQILTELKSLCGSDILTLKSDMKAKRRACEDDEAYKAIIDELNFKIEETVENNSDFVLQKYGVPREEFENMLGKYDDDEVKGLFNSLCVAEM